MHTPKCCATVSSAACTCVTHACTCTAGRPSCVGMGALHLHLALLCSCCSSCMWFCLHARPSTHRAQRQAPSRHRSRRHRSWRWRTRCACPSPPMVQRTWSCRRCRCACLARLPAGVGKASQRPHPSMQLCHAHSSNFCSSCLWQPPSSPPPYVCLLHGRMCPCPWMCQ